MAETTLPTDNSSLALRFGGADPAEWLARVDAGIDATVTSLLTHRRYTGAVECLLAHLVKTETTRTRIHGPAPTWADAVANFECAVDRQRPAQIQAVAALLTYTHRSTHTLAGGVNVTRLPVRASGPAGSKDTTNHLPSSWQGSPASPATPPPLVPVPVPALGGVDPGAHQGPECGHVSDFYRMRCVADAHPHNPDGHYYRSSTGSDVPDSAKEDAL